jgi:hypothetical protein
MLTRKLKISRKEREKEKKEERSEKSPTFGMTKLEKFNLREYTIYKFRAARLWSTGGLLETLVVHPQRTELWESYLDLLDTYPGSPVVLVFNTGGYNNWVMVSDMTLPISKGVVSGYRGTRFQAMPLADFIKMAIEEGEG